MENYREIILKKLSDLEQEFVNKKVKYQKCNSLMIKTESFVKGYERLLKNKKEKLCIMFFVLLSFVSLPSLALIYLLSQNLFNTFLGGIYSAVLGVISILGMKTFVEIEQELKKINKEIQSDKSKYEEQKKLLPSYQKAESVTYNNLKKLMDEITKTKKQLSQLNENQIQEIQSIVKKEFPNLCFNDEFDTCNPEETNAKVLVKVKK